MIISIPYPKRLHVIACVGWKELSDSRGVDSVTELLFRVCIAGLGGEPSSQNRTSSHIHHLLLWLVDLSHSVLLAQVSRREYTVALSNSLQLKNANIISFSGYSRSFVHDLETG